MKILIYEPNGQLQKFLASFMIRAKLSPITVDRESNILPLLQSREYEIFLADYSTKEDLLNDIIFNLKLDSRLTFIKIFITTPRPEKSVLQTLIQLGVNGFIKKPFTQDQFQVVFSSWMSKNSFSDNKRIHTRITPAPSDNAMLFLNIEGYGQEIPSEIVDISAGGVAILLPRSFERLMNNHFAVGMKIKGIRLRLRQVAVRINLEVITWVNNRLSLKFADLDDSTNKYIIHYIADNLQ